MQRKSDQSRHSPVQVGSPTLVQFVLLSMLLHALLIVLLGTATSGGARRGDGWWGPLDVTLRPMSPERGAGFTLAPGAETILPGAALLRRLGGAAPAPVAMPQDKAATPVAPPEPTRAAPAVPAPASSEVREAVPDVSLTPRPTSVESLPRLDRNAPEEVDKPLVSPTPVPPSVSPPVPESEIAPREFSMPMMAPLEPVAPARIDRQFAPPVELRPREIPVAPRPPPVEPKPQEKVAPSPVEMQPHEEAPPAPVEMKPREVAAPTPIETIAPAKIERELAPAIQPSPRSAPVEIAPSGERAAPAAAPGRSASTPARTETPGGGELPRLRYDAPDVDEEVFRSRRDGAVPAPEPGAAAGITGESLRKRAREIAREGSGTSGVLNLVPPPPPQERRDTLAEGIAKAAKPDCRTAYAGMGLLAVVPLVASTVGNGGCRW